MLLHLLDLRLVIGDDFNAVWDHVLDRTSTLQQRAEENAVVELQNQRFFLFCAA